MFNIHITAINTYLPAKRVSTEEISKKINSPDTQISENALIRLFGVKYRHIAANDEQVSDLAVEAALPIVEKEGRETIDLMIFAAASSDLIEPATANIIQQKLNLTCPVFDVKNACNSVITALDIAKQYIGNGTYKKVLIVNGEKLSDSVQYDFLNKEELGEHLAAYSFGDAGAALLVEPCATDKGIMFQKIYSRGEYWKLCTIKGGGSMHPHDASKLYFTGFTSELKDAFMKEFQRELVLSKDFIDLIFPRIKWVFTHQVSLSSFEAIAKTAGISTDKFISVVEEFGNCAAASIPLAIQKAINNNQLKSGDDILIIGLGSGLALSITYMVW